MVWWVRMRSGTYMPVTDEAISHFADCPEARHYRKSADVQDAEGNTNVQKEQEAP